MLYTGTISVWAESWEVMTNQPRKRTLSRSDFEGRSERRQSWVGGGPLDMVGLVVDMAGCYMRPGFTVV
jgi:hypothetical protein